MKRRLVEWLRCPDCRAPFSLEAGADGDGNGGEVFEGDLVCARGHRFSVRDGIPRLHVSGAAADETQKRTAASFGYSGSWLSTITSPASGDSYAKWPPSSS